MTLNGHCALKSVLDAATNGLASPAFGQNCSKLSELSSIHCQRQKCSPGNVVSGSIRFMQIFAGVSSRGASNESRAVEKAIFASFARYVFRIFTSKATFITLCYVAY